MAPATGAVGASAEGLPHVFFGRSVSADAGAAETVPVDTAGTAGFAELDTSCFVLVSTVFGAASLAPRNRDDHACTGLDGTGAGSTCWKGNGKIGDDENVSRAVVQGRARSAGYIRRRYHVHTTLVVSKRIWHRVCGQSQGAYTTSTDEDRCRKVSGFLTRHCVNPSPFACRRPRVPAHFDAKNHNLNPHIPSWCLLCLHHRRWREARSPRATSRLATRLPER